MYISDHISLISFRMIYVSSKSRRENQNILCSVTFFSENHVAFEIMWKNLLKVAGYRRKYGALSLHTWYLRLKNAIRICNTDYFSTVTMVGRKRLNVTFMCTLPVLLVSLNFQFANTISLVVTKNIAQDYDTDRQVLLVVMWNRSLHKNVSQLSSVIMNNSISTVDNSLVVDTSPVTETSYPSWFSGSRIVKLWPLRPHTVWSRNYERHENVEELKHVGQ
jgi:hypothetical protein